MTIDNIYSEEAPNEVRYIRLSDEERVSEQPKMSTVRECVKALHRDGIVLIENAIDMDHVEKVKVQMMKDAHEMFRRETTYFNFDDKGVGNFSQPPPVFPGLIFKDVYANPLVVAIVSSMIGAHAEFTWMFGNTLFKTKEQSRQDVHADIKWDYYDFPSAVTINILFQDVTPENGSTEIWVGSHKTSSMKKHVKPPNKFMGKIDPAELEKRRATKPPIYPHIKKGTILLRDIRLWHAGMPNHTDIPRLMFGAIFFPAWYENEMKVLFPASAKPHIDALGDGFRFVAEYIDDEKYDHLSLPRVSEYAPIGVQSPVNGTEEATNIQTNV